MTVTNISSEAQLNAASFFKTNNFTRRVKMIPVMSEFLFSLTE